MSEDYSFLKPYYEQALRMQDEGVVQSYANLKTGSIHYISVFEQQQCAMLPMGSWFIGTLIQDKEAGKYDFNWGVTTIPHPADTQAGATVGSTTPVAINAKTDVPDLAWEYVKFVTGEEGAMYWPTTESSRQQNLMKSAASLRQSPDSPRTARLPLRPPAGFWTVRWMPRWRL